MKSFTLITTALVLVGSLLTAANAAPSSDIPTAVVKFGDLDTAQPAAQEELYRRLSRAVRTVCSPLENSPGSLTVGLSRFKACTDQAVSAAVARINRPEFTEYVASRMPKPDRTGIQLASR